MEVIEAVKHYQRSIERCPGNQERMLHCISKLYHLPVTVQHLQETGVGRTVNGLRKYEGDTGDAAKALVAKWKAMVAAEVSDSEPVEENAEEEEEVEEEEAEPDLQPEPEVCRESHHKSSRERHHKSSHSHHRSHSERKHRDDGKSKSSHKRRAEDSDREAHEEKRRRKDESESSSDNEDDSDSEEMQIEVKGGGDDESGEENDDAAAEGNQDSSDSSEDERKSKHHSSRNSHHNDSHHKHEKHKDHHSESKKHSSSSNSKKTESNEEKVRSKSSSDDHHRKSDKKSDSGRHTSDKHRSDKYKNSEKHKKDESEKHRKDDSEKHRKDDSGKHRKEESDRHTKDSSDKHKRDRSEKSDKNRMDSSERHKKDEVRVKKEPVDSPQSEKSRSQSDNIPKHSSSKSSKKSSESKTKDTVEAVAAKIKKEPVEQEEEVEDQSIDNFSGASFAEALGMLDPVASTKKKSPHTSSPSPSSHKSSQKKSEPSRSKEPKPSKPAVRFTDSPQAEPDLLASDARLEPLERNLEVDVDSTLPAINPHYRPLPHIPVDGYSQRKNKALTEEEALSQIMSTKNLRMKVFSGVKSKSWAAVPSLYDICIRVLQENIDALEYTGGVPYDLLKPVLQHATPEQLQILEYHNNYLIEDTDELWEKHCQKIFRNKGREELETFREMYLRCLEEREAKLKALTSNIQQSQIAKTAPIRKTKLAYVDSVVKPPRNVVRQQMKFGTGNSKSSSPLKATKVAAAAMAASSASGNAVPVPAPPSRASHSGPKVKPRMAPLMQKTMKLVKSFKR